jgi:hypothetical protein
MTTCDKGHHPPEWCADENCFVCVRCGIYLCTRRRGWGSGGHLSALDLARKEFQAKARKILYAPVAHSVSYSMMLDLEPLPEPKVDAVLAKFHTMESGVMAESTVPRWARLRAQSYCGCDLCTDFHRFASRGYSFPTTGDLCVFCLCSRQDGPGMRCSFGLGHEWPPAAKTQQKPAKKPDNKLCQKCGLHPQNPTFKTNGCEHSWPLGS